MVRGISMAFLAICFLVGALGLFVAFQLYLIQEAAGIEPQSITLANLIDRGTGDNAHVTVNEFNFGTPIVEKQDDGKAAAWVPMFPKVATNSKVKHPLVLWRVEVPEKELPTTLQTKALTAVVCSEMPGLGSWDLRLPLKLAKELSIPKDTKVLLLTDPELRIMGWCFEPDLLFSPSNNMFAWIIGGVLTVLGLGGLLWMSREDTLVDRAEAAAVATSTLATEPAVSIHEFNNSEFVSRGKKIFIFCGGLIGLCFLLLINTFSLMSKSPDVAKTVMGVSVVLIVINVFLINTHFQYRSYGVSSIEVLGSGLRWSKSSNDSKLHTSAWSQISEVEIKDQSPYPWRHTMKIRLKSGEVLMFAGFSLVSFHAFAKLVRDCYTGRSKPISVAAGFGGI